MCDGHSRLCKRPTRITWQRGRGLTPRLSVRNWSSEVSRPKVPPFLCPSSTHRQSELVKECAISLNGGSHQPIVRCDLDVGVEVLLVAKEAHPVAGHIQVVIDQATLTHKLTNVANDVAES